MLLTWKPETEDLSFYIRTQDSFMSPSLKHYTQQHPLAGTCIAFVSLVHRELARRQQLLTLFVKLLFEERKTVVYLVRTVDKEGYYYEFIPGNDANSVITNIYGEKDKKEIERLTKTDMYYIVDPGRTKDNCDPPADFLPKVIIVASPDDGHLGGSKFEKERRGMEGCFKYMQVWTLEEILTMRVVIVTDKTLEEEITDRFCMFGGVPRHIFGSKAKLLDAQTRAINMLQPGEAQGTYNGNIDGKINFQSSQPKNEVQNLQAIFCIFSRDHIDGIFSMFLNSLSPNSRIWKIIRCPYPRIIGWCHIIQLKPLEYMSS